MKFYGIVDPTGKVASVHLDKDLPEPLALGDRGEVLAVFRVKEKLRSFVRAHRSLRADGPGSAEPVLLGTDFFELAQTISPITQAGKVERVVFDPVLDANGVWVKQSMDWSAESLCTYLMTLHPIVLDMARRAESLPEDSQPSPEAVEAALSQHMLRSAIFLTAERLILQGYPRLGNILLHSLRLMPLGAQRRTAFGERYGRARE